MEAPSLVLGVVDLAQIQPVHVQPLASPLEQTGEINEEDAERLGRTSYFVAISTIEPARIILC